MNARLQTLLAEVEALFEPEQDALARVIEEFLAGRGEAMFTPEEIEEIRRIESEPLELADPAEVDAFIAAEGVVLALPHPARSGA